MSSFDLYQTVTDQIIAMLDAGVWLPPSQFEAAFLSTAHGQVEIVATITAAKEAFKTVRSE